MIRSLLSASLLSVTFCCDFSLSDRPVWGDDLYEAADVRIDQHRKADATVVVVDEAGNAIPNAAVKVEQTSHAFLFGCNIFQWGRTGNIAVETLYREQFAELFNYATLPFYWPSYESRRGRTDHLRIERIAKWCQDQGIVTKGHPLAWNFSDPSWLPNEDHEVRALQMSRIDDCVGRFRGLIDRWDVVNEATDFQRDAMKQKSPKITAMWAKVGQVEFVRECFRHARTTSEKATLLINDYRTDAAYEDLLHKLTDEGGKPLFDEIGIQSHMHERTWNNAKLWDVCQRFATFGVPLHFTETTIVSGERVWEQPERGRPWSSTSAGETWQAGEVERVYKMLFSHPAVTAITWWDFSDRGAWKGAPAGFLRANMTAKPSYDRLHELVKNKWWTRASLATDAQGRAKFRGFLGQYQVTVESGGKTASATLTLEKSRPNRLPVRIH